MGGCKANEEIIWGPYRVQIRDTDSGSKLTCALKTRRKGRGYEAETTKCHSFMQIKGSGQVNRDWLVPKCKWGGGNYKAEANHIYVHAVVFVQAQQQVHREQLWALRHQVPTGPTSLVGSGLSGTLVAALIPLNLLSCQTQSFRTGLKRIQMITK